MPHVVCSGHFLVPHSGHVAYLEAAHALAAGGRLTVIVNNDLQVFLKKKSLFLPLRHRLAVIGAFKRVSGVIASVDVDASVNETLRALHRASPVDVFANGGDVRDGEDCLEAALCASLGIEMVFGVGGGKQASSTDFLPPAGRRV